MPFCNNHKALLQDSLSHLYFLYYERVINIVLRVYRKSGIADSQITVIQKFRSLNALNIVVDVSALFAFCKRSLLY